MDDEFVTGLTIAAIVVYTTILVVYILVAFTSKASRYYKGPARFWTVVPGYREKGQAPGHLRWAQVTLKTAAFNGIQSLRCLLQAGVYYCASCVTIAFFVTFLTADTNRPQLIYLLMGCIAVSATVCFIQHMRFCYHLGFLVMFQQPKNNANNAANNNKTSAAPSVPGTTPFVSEPATPTNHHASSSIGFMEGLAARRKFNKAVALHVVGDGGGGLTSVSSQQHVVGGGQNGGGSLPVFADTNNTVAGRHDGLTVTATSCPTLILRPSSPPPSSPAFATSPTVPPPILVNNALHINADDKLSADMIRHIEAENNFDIHKHTARVAYVVQRHAFNFALGLRLMIFIVPLALGTFGDELLIVSTVCLLPILVYLDRMAY